MKFPATIIYLLAFTISSFGEMRAWKSTDGLRSLTGELVKEDEASITIKTVKGQMITLDRSKLHADELTWLAQQKKAAAPDEADKPGQSSSAMFDTLEFGDSREVVLEKLRASAIVEMAMDETFIGRSGLNGIFRTRQKIGKLNAFLYFDWCKKGKLKELNLQTEPLAAPFYSTDLELSWTEFVKLLSTLYGQPVQQGPMAKITHLTDGSFVPSHLWNLEGGGGALLGTAQDGKKYQLVVRFKETKPRMVEIP